MRTTLEIPVALFGRVKSGAAERGQALKAFVGEALSEKLGSKRRAAPPGDPERMQGFGKRRRLHRETERRPKGIQEGWEPTARCHNLGVEASQGV